MYDRWRQKSTLNPLDSGAVPTILRPMSDIPTPSDLRDLVKRRSRKCPLYRFLSENDEYQDVLCDLFGNRDTYPLSLRASMEVLGSLGLSVTHNDFARRHRQLSCGDCNTIENMWNPA